MKIKLGTKNDFNNILKLFKILDEQHIAKRKDFKNSINSKRYADILNRCINDENYVLCIAENNDEIISFGVGRLFSINGHSFLKDQKIGEILYLIVSDKFKNKGIGTKILTFLESELINKGSNLLELRVYDFNKEAIPEKVGYKKKITIYEKIPK